MRIINGKFKNKPIIFIKNNEIRPISSKVKGSIFNVLFSMGFDIEGANVLDICCGTGAFSLECASRGASKLTMLDSNHTHLKICRENVAEFGIEKICKILHGNASFLPEFNSKFDLVFIDPPYSKNIISGILENLAKQNCLSENAIIIIKTHKHQNFETPTEFLMEKEKFYGITKVTFLNFEPLITHKSPPQRHIASHP